MSRSNGGSTRRALRIGAIPLAVLAAVAVSGVAIAGTHPWSRHRLPLAGHRSPSSGATAPSASASPSPPATATPQQSPSAPAGSKPPNPTTPAGTSGFPNAANTGYPHGLPGDTRKPVTLTPYTGPCQIKVPGTIIDGKDISCSIVVRASGVTIRNSRIRVANTKAIDINDFYNVLIQDTEVDGQGKDDSVGGISLIGDGSFTLERVNAHSSGDILRADWHAAVYDSWLHDPSCLRDTCHNDVIQTTQTKYLRIVHNRLENPHTQTSCILEKADLGPIDDVVVDRNLFNGGGYSVYWYDARYKATNGAFTNNRFMRAPAGGFWPKGGYYGPAATQASQQPTWTNNAWDDTGAAIPG